MGVAVAAANEVSQAEWLELTKQDCGLSIKQQVLKHRKCPYWFKKTIAQQSDRQHEFAVLLCREANLAVNKFLTICDISRFEELLNVDILVVSSRLGNKFIRVPSDANSTKQRFHLYLVELDKSFHFHVGGWSGGAMVLGKLPVPGRPTVLITVGQGPIALAVGAGGGGLDIFTLIYPFSSFSLSLGDGSI